MRAFVLVLACAAACAAPPSNAPTTSSGAAATDDAAIAQAGEAYLQLVLAIAPEHATELGLHARDGELDDRSAAGFEQGLGREEAMLRDLETRFAQPRASLGARTDLTILMHELAVDVRTKRAVRPLETQPDLYASPMSAVHFMMSHDYAPAADRARAALARIETIPRVLDQARVNLKNPPRVWTQVGLEKAQSAKAFFEAERGPLEAALPSETARIEADLASAESAFRAYADLLEKEVLPRSTGSFAAGRPLFEFLLHEGYALRESSDDLYALAQRIFATTEAQMKELARRIDPAAPGWPEALAKLKEHHPAAAGLVDAYRREVGRARDFLVAHHVVPFPAGETLRVEETPPFERTTIVAEYVEPPPFDRDTPGYFYVTPVDPSLPREAQEQMLRESDQGDLVDTAVHEAYPGHHLQGSFARLHPSRIRRALSTAIFDEGWALYCEELMAELDYYTPEERITQLQWTLVRAARVMIDVGLHTRGMSFDEAVALLTDRVHLERTLAVSEVKRYTETPTQPLSYLIGREEIFRLRERYRAREGARYTLERFHAEVLAHGSIAPGLLETEMFGG